MCDKTQTPIDAYAIALDETANYEIDENDRPYIKQIRAAYLFDRNQRTHCCETTPSYYLIYLYNEMVLTDEGLALDEYAVDELYQKYESYSGDDIYVHCCDVERLIERDERFTVYHYGSPEVDEPGDRDAQMEELREELSCNHPF